LSQIKECPTEQTCGEPIEVKERRKGGRKKLKIGVENYSGNWMMDDGY
jgi:hypothetical protein